MKVGDVIDAGLFLNLTEESAQIMVDAVSDDGVGSGDLTFHGVRLVRVTVVEKDGKLEIENVD